MTVWGAKCRCVCLRDIISHGRNQQIMPKTEKSSIAIEKCHFAGWEIKPKEPVQRVETSCH